MKSDFPTLGLFSQLLEKLIEEKAISNTTSTEEAGKQKSAGSGRRDPAARPVASNPRRQGKKPVSKK